MWRRGREKLSVGLGSDLDWSNETTRDDKTHNGNNEACGAFQNDRDDKANNVNGDDCDVIKRDHNDEVHNGNQYKEVSF